MAALRALDEAARGGLNYLGKLFFFVRNMNDVYLSRAASHAKPNVRSATLIRNLDMSSSREEYGGRMMWLLHVLHVTNRLR